MCVPFIHEEDPVTSFGQDSLMLAVLKDVIQEVLTEFEAWSNYNNMSLNPTKCMSMTDCFSQDQESPTPLCIANKQLAEVNVVKILGVQISSDLKGTK